MYHIFIIYETEERNSKTRDYLQLSGYTVEEKSLAEIQGCEGKLDCMDLILLQGEQIESFYEICERLRIFTQIPIMVLTTNDDEWMKIKMFQAGVDDYLVEPYLQGELIARIQGHRKRYERLTKSFGYIRIREMEIETASRRVFIRGKEIAMTTREFDVLVYLVERANQVVKKEDIYFAIWREPLGNSYYNSVAVNIKKLRQKLETDPDNPQIIETIWGLGYRFRL